MSYRKIKFHILRLLSVLLCLFLFLSFAPTVYAAEGTCGNELTWSFDGSTLTISGSGAMENYTEAMPAPWYGLREQILNLYLPEGLTRIGTRAFAECTGLSVVNIPGTVEVIADSAFLGCSSMTMLTLNTGNLTIEQRAFSQCTALADLRLPDTLLKIGHHAFYMCESLSYVTIPGYVREIGSGVFSYCSNLIRADINAAAQMPAWSFYGCNRLEVVTILGEAVEPESLMISTPPQGIFSEFVDPDEDGQPTLPDREGTGEPGSAGAGPEVGYVSGESITTDQNGQQVVDRTTVVQNEDATTITTNRTPLEAQEGSTAQGTVTTITATVQNEAGWQDVVDKVNSATIGGNANTVNVTVYVPNSDAVSAGVLQKFAGKKVSLNIQTGSGSQYTLDCTRLESDLKNDLELNYTLVSAEDVPEELEGCTVYRLKFTAEARIPAQLVIRLPGVHALSTATLYQMKGMDKLEKLQSVIVDPYGDAHWYVSAVDEKTEYLIGIDVPQTEQESPIIPPTLHDVYKVENVHDGVEYVVTGRTSSWGMELNQVMGIMAAVMVTVIVVVGVVVYLWNKNRMKRGYVPGWDDAEDDE